LGSDEVNPNRDKNAQMRMKKRKPSPAQIGFELLPAPVRNWQLAIERAKKGKRACP
jgi:hypothetical protein